MEQVLLFECAGNQALSGGDLFSDVGHIAAGNTLVLLPEPVTAMIDSSRGLLGEHLQGPKPSIIGIDLC